MLSWFPLDSIAGDGVISGTVAPIYVLCRKIADHAQEAAFALVTDPEQKDILSFKYLDRYNLRTAWQRKPH